jgi:hypothetical protein
MIELKDKIKIALDESRMLVLGTQILLGFQFRAAFEPAFDQLPSSSKVLKITALVVLLIAITLIMAPGSYHRIVREGRDAEDVHHFATTMMDVALVPFVMAFSVREYVLPHKGAFAHDPAFFVHRGFSIVPHTWVPEKIALDCNGCPLFRNCGQYAVVLDLDRAYAQTLINAAARERVRPTV